MKRGEKHFAGGRRKRQRLASRYADCFELTLPMHLFCHLLEAELGCIWPDWTE